MTLRLIGLDCPACGSAMRGDRNDVLFFCPHCGSGALLEDDGLQTVESTALLPSPGRHSRVWKPAWIIEAEITVDDRIRADGRRTRGRRDTQTFVMPAFLLPLDDLIRLARALSEAAGSVGEVPREPIRGGTLTLEDALTLCRHIVVGDEVRRSDMLASVQVEVQEKEHRLAAIPFEETRDGLRCAVTGVAVRSVDRRP
ncbi:hypothetical protein [Petrachloros mirabilis]